MINYEELFSMKPYSINKIEKKEILTKILSNLTNYHYKKSESYKNIIDGFGYDINSMNSYYDIPFLPVRLFKELDLLSVDKEEIFKIMTSSGTTGQSVSKIYLDRETSMLQQKTLVKIVSEFTGKKRMPMLIIDSSSVVKDRKMFSARGAGILGFSIFASDRAYALDEEMNINIEIVENFLKKHQNEKILLFGFTFMIWQHFYKELVYKNIKFDLSNAILIHGGGWKKLQSEAVSNVEFKKKLNEVCGIEHIHNYYGMVEQTGCIYMECEYGHLHASIFSDVIMRRTKDFSVCDIGEKGIVEVVSMLPKSYCGHLLLTEDEGLVLGEDDCLCGRLGKYFKIDGRIKDAEIRGCSDTYATKF